MDTQTNQSDQNDIFVLTADVQEYVPTDSVDQTTAPVVADDSTNDQNIDPASSTTIDDGPVDVTEIELQPTDGQEAPQEAPEITQIEDGVYLDANGQGLEAALAAYQEAVSEGVDFGGEAGTWYYQGGAFAFIGA